MKQTIEIEVPYGKKAVWKDNKVIFEDIEPQLPKTWEEFCKLYPIKNGEAYITEFSNIQVLEDVVVGNRKPNDITNLPSEEAAKQHLTLMQLHQLRDCYRQGWTPELGKPSYGITRFKDKGHYTVNSHDLVSRFLSFQTVELAQQFLNNFRDLIEQAGDLI